MKKTEKNILTAFLLNLVFSLIELIGGMITNSVAIISDSIHDLGDALSIGVSFFLEKKSKKKADKKHTFGYIRYSVLGSVITTSILFAGSLLVIIKSIGRIITPEEINYKGMIVLSVFGVIINFIAAYKTKEGDSLNQQSVNLHMLEDTLGWCIVLIGAIIMNYTDISVIDPIMSIAVALFILINSIKNLKRILDLFLEKTPNNIDIDRIEKELINIDGIDNVHHIHIWSIDGYNNYSTLHVVTQEKDTKKIKDKVRKKLLDYEIVHTTIEIEDKECNDNFCDIKLEHHNHEHHH